MATIKRELSAKVDARGKSEIILRLSYCRGVQPRIKSGLFITPSRFEAGAIVKPRGNTAEATELRKLELELLEIETFLLNLCPVIPKQLINKTYLNEQVARRQHPENFTEDGSPEVTFWEHFQNYLNARNLSHERVKHYNVLLRALKRFEAYRNATNRRGYKITIDDFNVDDINDFEAFLRNEPAIFEQHPEIFIKHPSDTRKIRKAQKPLTKGDNTIVCMFSYLRAFYNWCNGQGITDNKPFAKYAGNSVERYGTPYYLSIDERNHIADFDLTASPALEAQRDIFIFQCLIGCRVSDLLRLTPANIINGAVEYIATKTKHDRPEVLRVPLHARAAELITKYQGRPDDKLFPFISAQRYNDAIKEIFTVCGITRAVTILNPTTGQEEQRPLNEIASSHIARRTFVGNLYRKVKDPNLVGKLSGHKEGSKAFSRYRDIDEEIKKEVIQLLDD